MSTATLNGKTPAILGPTGQPFLRETKQKLDVQTRGFYGLSRFLGLVTEEYLPALSGTRKVDVYDRMRADAMVEAVTLAVTLPVIAASWTIEPAGDDANAKRAAELAEDCLFNQLGDCWEDEVRKALSYLQFGWQLVVKQWEIVNGEARVTELRDLHPRTILQGGRNWEMDERGRVLGVWQYGTDGTTFREEFVPASSFLHFVNGRQFGNPEGRSLYRSAYKHWFLKDSLYKYEAIGLERSAVGTPVGTYPTDGSFGSTQQTELYEFLKGIVSHEEAAAIFPAGVEITNASVDLKTEALQASISHHDAKIAQAVLAQFLTLGQDGRGGAYALSSDQTDLFMLCLESVGDYVAAHFSRRVIKDLVAYNIATDQYPKLACTVARENAQALATAVRQLAAGVNPLITPDEPLEDHLREQLKLPPREGPRQAPQPAPTPPGAEPDPVPAEQQMSRERITLGGVKIIPRGADDWQASEEPVAEEFSEAEIKQAFAEFDAAVPEEFRGLLDATQADESD